MNTLKTIIERLREDGIREVAVIDDVFDGPTETDLGPALNSFYPAFERAADNEAINYLQETFGVYSTSDVSISTAQALWDKFRDLPPSVQPFAEELLGEFLRRRKDVETICEHLISLNLDVKTMGDPGRDPDKLPQSAQLVFLDYSLTPGRGTTSEASEWCAMELSKRDEKRPFLVLFSDNQDAPAQETRFRRDNQKLGGTFAFVTKEAAKNVDTLCLYLATWGVGNPARRSIQKFVDAVTLSMDATIHVFNEALRELTVQDYSVIQRICLSEDGQPLGEYMLDLFTGLLSHNFQKTSQIQDARKALDELVFGKIIVSSTPPSTQLARIYRMALTQPVVGDVTPHPHTLVNSESVGQRGHVVEVAVAGEDVAQALPPLLGLGDMFLKNAAETVLLVVNAACDLSFSPLSKNRQVDLDQPIYLVPGKMVSLRDNRSLAGKEVTEIFEHDDGVYKIIWDYQHAKTVRLQDFRSMITKDGYHRVARLALPYALKIQRSWTAHLDRVGLPTPPAMSEEVDVDVWARNAFNRWERISQIPRGALLVRHRRSTGYENFVLLTFTGEAHLHEAVVKSTTMAEQRIKKTEDDLEAIPAELRQQRAKKLTDKLKAFRTAHEQLCLLQQNTSLRLSLMESPRKVDPVDCTWIKSSYFAMYFNAGSEEVFIQDAQLVMNVRTAAA